MKTPGLAMGCCVLLAACASGPPTRIYLLAAPVGAGAAPSTSGPPVQLQTVLVPDYLDTTDIVLRAGLHEVAASPAGRWGERLSQGITHALQADLAGLLPGGRVTLSPPADAAAAQVLVSVDAFDAWPDGSCVLRAHWTVLLNPAAVSGRIGRGAFTRPAGSAVPAGDAANAAAMADAVDDLARAIVRDLQHPAS